MMGDPDNGDQSPVDKSKNRGGEGPISPAELEERNRERARTVIYVEAQDEAEVTIRSDGGTKEADFLSQVSDDKLLKVIVILVLILLIVAVWRIGALAKVVGWIVAIAGL